jgi:tetratricopeptide (TPR) repeat protein
MHAATRSIGSALAVVALAAGAALLGYARWTRPAARADAEIAAGRLERALAEYAEMERRFDRASVLKQAFRTEYERVVANQVWVLYRVGRLDEAIDKAERAPDRAATHFLAGCALFRKASAETKPEARLGWLTRAEEALRRAIEADPADWDTKYDFELVTRLAAELRRQPKTPPAQLMELLRPPPPARPTRRVG